MARSALVLALAAHAALVLSAVPGFAQVSGGEYVAQEFVGVPGVAQQIREREVARLASFQALQALRSGATLAGVATAVPQGFAPAGSLNGSNPAADRSTLNQAAVARIPGRAEGGLLAGFSGGRPLSRPPPAFDAAPSTTVIDNSQNLFVNANGSPVAIGSNNVIRQQVANSVATSVGGPAIANSAAESGPGRGRAGQTASSSAVSLGAGAASTSSNNEALPRVGAR
jgi:hypothetical protein